MNYAKLGGAFVLGIATITALWACVGDEGTTVVANGDASDDGNAMSMQDGPSAVTDGGTTGQDSAASSDGGHDASVPPVPGAISALALIDESEARIAVAPNGDVGVATFTFNSSSTIGNTTVDAGGNGNLIVGRYKPNQSVAWVRAFGSGTAYVQAVSMDANGDFYVSLMSPATSFMGVPGHTDKSNLAIIARFDALTGNLVWVKSFGSVVDGDNSMCPAIATNGSNGLLAVGCTFNGTLNYATLGGSAMLSSATQGNTDGAVLEIDTGTGDVKWAKRLHGSTAGANTDATESVESITFGPGDRVIAAGTSSSAILTDNGTFTANAVGVAGATDAFVVKFDSNQVALWSRRFANTEFPSLAVAPVSNQVILCGELNGASDLGSGALNPSGGAGDIDAVLLALDGAAGGFKWVVHYGGAFGDACQRVVSDAADHVFVMGIRESASVSIGAVALTDPPPRGNASLASDNLRFDAAGNLVWASTFTSPVKAAFVNSLTIGLEQTTRLVTAGYTNATTYFGSADASATPPGTGEAYVVWQNQ